jgi:photosystem II stability/assembly factor-like uncharacterized protein
MKKLLPLLLILLFTAACTTPTATPAPAEPPTASAPPVSLPVVEAPQLVQSYFVDAHNGWGITETKIVCTEDGGVTWYNVTPAGVEQINYAPFVFVDAQAAAFLIANADYATGTLYRTTDGGVSWAAHNVPFAYASLQFLDVQNGFALAALGAGAGSEAVALFKTTDGGANWSRVFINDPTVSDSSDSLPLGGQKSGFTFLNESRGWVGGSIPMDNVIYLYETQDGGVTWNLARNIALPAGYEGAQTGNSAPQFFSATEGILVASMVVPSQDGMITIVYRTRDGGQTWTPGTAIPRARPVDFHTASEGVAWVGGQFYVTRDAGQSWGAVQPNEDFADALVSLQFVDSLNGWAMVSRDGVHTSLYKTADGGATWSALIP